MAEEESSEGENSDEVSPSGNSALEPRKAPSRPMHLPDSFSPLESFPEELPPSAELSPLDAAAVHRIVEQVGEHELPLDYDLLRRQLLWCFVRHNSLEQGTSGPLAKKRALHFQKIERAAVSFRELFADGLVTSWTRNKIAGSFYKDWDGESGKDEAMGLAAVLSGVDRVAEIARQLAAEPSHPLFALDRSVIEWIVGVMLPDIFEFHFKRHATIARNSYDEGKADSPFIRFAVSSLRELGLRKTSGEAYRAEYVARAFSDVRNKKSRRKNQVKVP